MRSLDSFWQKPIKCAEKTVQQGSGARWLPAPSASVVWTQAVYGALFIPEFFAGT